MRPRPILWFEGAVLLAAAIDLINNVIAFPMLRRGLAMRGFVLGEPAMVASVLLTPLLCVILWYCIARRGSVLGKWLMAAYVAGSVVLFVRQMAITPPVSLNPMLIAAVAAQLLRLGAVMCLFLPSAQPWFREEHVA